MQVRQFIAVWCIIIYIVAIGYPFVLNCSYKLNKTYIAQNLCINRLNPDSECNGKCYLMNQLNGMSKNSPSDNAQPITFNVYETVPHEIVSGVHLNKIVESIRFYKLYSTFYKSDYITDIVIPPPQLV